MVGIGVAWSSPFVVGVGVAWSSSSAIRSALTSFLAGHRAPLSLVRSCPGRRTIVGVDAGGVALMACVRPVVARGGRAWFSWALVVVCALSCRLCAVVSFARGRVVCAWSCRLRDVVSFARFRCLC